MKLKKYSEKDNKKKGIIVFSICCIFLITGVFFYSSYAWYEENENFNLINGNIEDPGDIYFAFYVDDVISSSMPKENSGYTLDTTKSSCNNGVTITWENSMWEVVANYRNYNATDRTRTKCNLYFVKNMKTVNTVLGNIEVNQSTPDFTKSSCSDETCESHEMGIYETTDDDGTSYYYRGSVENNYVKFGGFYWRIIRINGNGSIRMIYDGTAAHTNGESSVDRYYTMSKFNGQSSDNIYVGYMYESGNAHGITTSSTIKTAVDNFYKEKLSSYAEFLDTESGFCGDRSTLNNINGAGTGTISTYYSGYLRVEMSTPSLSCSNTSDYYTVSSSSKGNKALTYPIGLITADEVMLAGHGGGMFNGNQNYTKTNTNSYLIIGSRFWTITSAGGYNCFGALGWNAFNLFFGAVGELDDGSPLNSFGIRPVINIKSTVKISGNGTMESPYIIS